MLRTSRQGYWIVGCRNLVKAHIRQCVIYTRQAAKSRIQLMGDLSSPRANPSSPLSHTGFDYAGPFGIPYVGQSVDRENITLFVCLATKAIQLECVEDYATTSLLAAFCRFLSRRGLPSHMYSDNGMEFLRR